DGLVHISALSHSFVKDPRDVVKAGDIVKVLVMEVDVARKRIGLSMRLDDKPGEQTSIGSERRGGRRQSQQRSFGGNGGGKSGGKANQDAQGGMAALFAQAAKKKGGRL
ncbi:MAG: S1 RNA-binding domain-containing protein, partial [Pseudomonadota bacterium]|nr:S1 RNA-binding domain-containing protein [Pseudomonadota bacterium]